ncbi:MAG: sugar ABC transporter permease [Lachnospiraceae bacterium]|nr:sugar ABC transporter permease [Lachnospiraceae bacterium]MDE7271702.1 sugar ABC transporter permease [Lachnospiraceae bacterium]
MAATTAAKDSGKSFNFKKWARSRSGQQAIIIVTFSLIPLLLLLVFTYYPFVEMFKFSFYDRDYIKVRSFVGLQNYVDVFKRDDCFRALWLSLYYMGGAIVQLALALYLATIFSFGVKGGNFFKGCMFFPYLINGIAIGFIFKFFYTRGFVFDTVLQWIGFDLENLPYWLRDTRINNVSLVGTSVWKYFGQNMVLFIGAMMSVDSSLYEAADLDGANKWQQFKYIMLPSIKTIVMLNLIMSITGSLSAFEPPFVIMSGGANGTATYFVKMHEIAHTSRKVGLASAMAIVLLLIIFAATILQQLFFKYVFRNAEDEDKSAAAKREKKLAKLRAKEGGRA